MLLFCNVFKSISRKALYAGLGGMLLTTAGASTILAMNDDLEGSSRGVSVSKREERLLPDDVLRERVYIYAASMPVKKRADETTYSIIEPDKSFWQALQSASTSRTDREHDSESRPELNVLINISSDMPEAVDNAVWFASLGLQVSYRQTEGLIRVEDLDRLMRSSLFQLNLTGQVLRRSALECIAGRLTESHLRILTLGSIRIISGEPRRPIILESYRKLKEGYNGLKGAEEHIKRLEDAYLPLLKHAEKEDERVSPELRDSSSSMGSEGAVIIADALRNNRRLQELNLSCNDIGIEGVTAIGAMLRENNSLRSLNLALNGICDKGSRALAEGIGMNEALQRINLSDNLIHDEGGTAIKDALEKNKGLRKLDFRQNCMSEEVRQRIRNVADRRTPPFDINI